MEQNLPIITKKIWNIAKIALFMLKKGISKKKIVQKLSIMIQRQKPYINTLQEYEFSCSNTPIYRQYFTNKRSTIHQEFNFEAMTKIHLEEIHDVLVNKDGEVARQPRISDSSFWAHNDLECIEHVNEAADEFIKRFYSQLKKETC
ncbi:unnamed protein product [Amaranthus hypochondriacus]